MTFSHHLAPAYFRSVAGQSTEAVRLDYTFDEPGEYVASVNGVQAESTVTVVEGDATQDEETDDSTSSETERTGDSNSGPDQDENTVTEQPGFGIVQTVATLCGAGYLLKRKMFEDK
ncbi:PGF-CTERM sorting domain-containing protein [Halobellus salinisoli]|uniref:PGF-CTERM sorting domain-containing protein n=1 Tax=Halobellus salinisoli TaxID=3108500 RepID=UPI003CE500D1